MVAMRSEARAFICCFCHLAPWVLACGCYSTIGGGQMGSEVPAKVSQVVDRLLQCGCYEVIVRVLQGGYYGIPDGCKIVVR